MKEITRDTMPKKVATEMLCAPGIRQTNRERKQYQQARIKAFASELMPKPVEVKVAGKLADKTLVQLLKWSQRSAKRRRGLQRRYERVKALPQNPVTVRLLAAIDLQAAGITVLMDCLDDELDHRTKKNGN